MQISVPCRFSRLAWTLSNTFSFTNMRLASICSHNQLVACTYSRVQNVHPKCWVTKQSAGNVIQHLNSLHSQKNMWTATSCSLHSLFRKMCSGEVLGQDKGCRGRVVGKTFSFSPPLPKQLSGSVQAGPTWLFRSDFPSCSESAEIWHADSFSVKKCHCIFFHKRGNMASNTFLKDTRTLFWLSRIEILLETVREGGRGLNFVHIFLHSWKKNRDIF